MTLDETTMASKQLESIIATMPSATAKEETINLSSIHRDIKRTKKRLAVKIVASATEDIKEELKRWDILLNRLSHSFSDQLEKSTYEVLNDLIKAGEAFRFAKGGRHYVKATAKFKMALLITLEN